MQNITTKITSTIGTKKIGKVFANGKKVGRFSTQPNGYTEFRTSVGQRPWTFASMDKMVAYLAQK